MPCYEASVCSCLVHCSIVIISQLRAGKIVRFMLGCTTFFLIIMTDWQSLGWGKVCPTLCWCLCISSFVFLLVRLSHATTQGLNLSFQAQSYEDVRCKCVCPNPSVVNGTQSNRKLYIGNVPPNKW